MLATAILLVGLASSPDSAGAAWFVISSADATCQPSADTPDAFKARLKEDWAETRTILDSTTGKIVDVMVLSRQDRARVYYVTKEACERAVTRGRAAGIIK